MNERAEAGYEAAVERRREEEGETSRLGGAPELA
jgi:hypothetical protein